MYSILRSWELKLQPPCISFIRNNTGSTASRPCSPTSMSLRCCGREVIRNISPKTGVLHSSSLKAGGNRHFCINLPLFFSTETIGPFVSHHSWLVFAFRHRTFSVSLSWFKKVVSLVSFPPFSLLDGCGLLCWLWYGLDRADGCSCAAYFRAGPSAYDGPAAHPFPTAWCEWKSRGPQCSQL